MIMTMICVLCVYWISACVRVAVHSVCPHIGWQQMIWSALHIWGNSNSHTHTHTVSLSLSLSPSSVIYIYSVPTCVCVTFHHTLHRLLSYIRYSSRTTTTWTTILAISARQRQYLVPHSPALLSNTHTIHDTPAITRDVMPDTYYTYISSWSSRSNTYGRSIGRKYNCDDILLRVAVWW